MYNKEKETQMNVFTVRFDDQMVDMIEYLKHRTMLNKTAIIRMSIANLYQREKSKDYANTIAKYDLPN